MPYTIAPHDLTLLFPILKRNQPCCISGNPFESHVDTTLASGLELVQPKDKPDPNATKSNGNRAHAAILNIKRDQMVYDIVYTFLLKYAIPPYHHRRLYDLVQSCFAANERQLYRRQISVRRDYRQWVLNVYDAYRKYTSLKPRDTTQGKTAESGDAVESVGDVTNSAYHVLCQALDPFVKKQTMMERVSPVSTPEISHGNISLDKEQIRNWFTQEYAESIELLQGMGFDKTLAVTALQLTGGHADDAVDMLLAQPDLDAFYQLRAAKAQEAMIHLYTQQVRNASEASLDTSTSPSTNSPDTSSLWSGTVTKDTCDNGSSSSSDLFISPMGNNRGNQSKDDPMLSTRLLDDDQDAIKTLIRGGEKETTPDQEVDGVLHHVQTLRQWLTSSEVTALVKKLCQISRIWITFIHRRLEEERQLPDVFIDQSRARKLLDTYLGLSANVKLAEPTKESTMDQSSPVGTSDISLALSQAVEEELRQMSFVDNFSVSLGRPIPVTHHLRLNATQLSTLLRPPIHPAQRIAVWAQTAASLYTARLHALVVLLTPNDWRLSKIASTTGTAHDGEDVYYGYGWVNTTNRALFKQCNASVDYHFPPVREQLTQIRTQLQGSGAKLRP
ncbi:hypothetical protein IWQ62_005392, partial [Dispira parvispora]